MHYRFGDCTLDTQRYELRRGGVRVPLRRKVFQVLVYLLEQRDRVVTRDEVLAQVWPDQYVGEETLTSCVKAVRRAVGDSGRAQRVIRTVHGHGLRFVADVTVAETAPSPGLQRPLRTVPPGAPAGTPLVGREAELATLHALVHHGPAGHAAGGVHHGRSRGGQNRPGGGLPRPGRRRGGGVDRARPVYRAVWDGRGVSPRAGSAGAPVPGASGGALPGLAAAARPELAGADAGAAPGGRA